jgi:hypothetical protein
MDEGWCYQQGRRGGAGSRVTETSLGFEQTTQHNEINKIYSGTLSKTDNTSGN